MNDSNVILTKAVYSMKKTMSSRDHTQIRDIESIYYKLLHRLKFVYSLIDITLQRSTV